VVAPAARLLAADFHYLTDPSNVFLEARRAIALARFLRREARSLFFC
jgi:hypothetical protein